MAAGVLVGDSFYFVMIRKNDQTMNSRIMLHFSCPAQFVLVSICGCTVILVFLFTLDLHFKVASLQTFFPPPIAIPKEIIHFQEWVRHD